MSNWKRCACGKPVVESFLKKWGSCKTCYLKAVMDKYLGGNEVNG